MAAPLTIAEKYLQALEDLHRVVQPVTGGPTIAVALDRLHEGQAGGGRSAGGGPAPTEVDDELRGTSAYGDPTGDAVLRGDPAISAIATIERSVASVVGATNDLLAGYVVRYVVAWPSGTTARLVDAIEVLDRVEPLVLARPRLGGRSITRLASAADRLVDECAAALQRGPTAKERRDTDILNQDPGCRSCTRLEVSKGVRRWEPVHGHGLCQWCLRFAGIHGAAGLRKGESAPATTWPPEVLLAAHHDGRRVTMKAG